MSVNRENRENDKTVQETELPNFADEMGDDKYPQNQPSAEVDEDDEDLYAPIEGSLDLQCVEVKLTLKDPDNPGKLKKRNLLLRELDGIGREQYLNAIGMKVRTSERGKVVGLKSFSGIETGLLTKCLVDVDTEKFVTEEEMRTWPSKLLSRLFKRAQRLNGLDKKAEVAAKNGSGEASG